MNENSANISGSAPGGTSTSMSSSISRVDSSCSGRSSGPAGLSGSVRMEEERDERWERGRECVNSDSDCHRQDEDEGG